MRTVLNIDRSWTFLKGVSEAPVQVPNQGEIVDLPHTWNARDGQDGGNDYFRGTCCYVKNLSRRDLPAGEKYFLEIQGANSSSQEKNEISLA